jgi:hypothetical protein
MAAKRPDDTVIPSLALATLAAMLHPEAGLDLDWPERSLWIDLLYESGPGAYLRARDRIELTRTMPAGSRQSVFGPDDLLACNKFTLEKPEEWQHRTVAYQTLLSCDDIELREWVHNKLVVIGDHRTRRSVFKPDRHRVKYGTSTINDVPGCYLLADAIAGLLSRHRLQVANPLPAATFWSMLCVAAIGCAVPIRVAGAEVLDRRRYRGVLWLVLLGVGAAAIFVMVAAKSYAAVHLGMAGFCLVGPMAGSFAVEFARNRHRVLDRSRQAIEDVGLATPGTITVTPRRPRSRLATG